MLNSERVENWQQQQGNKPLCISILRFAFLVLCLPAAKDNMGLGRCVWWVAGREQCRAKTSSGGSSGGRKMMYVVTLEVLLS